MLAINHLKKSFDHQTILRDVCFKARTGQLTILEGQNGAGKSTLFNILLGTLHADEGQIILFEKNITAMSAKKRAQDIAILKQDPKASSAPSLTVLENCALALLKHRRAGLSHALRSSMKKMISAHLKSLQLEYEQHLNKPMGKLSGGQRQIIAFAMATMYQPQLLLLDEPTAALDDQSSHLLMRLIKQLAKTWDIPAVMISHDHELNMTYGDSIILLQDGICIEKINQVGT